jgi:carbon-monoxide dehydrogenase medium subunit
MSNPWKCKNVREGFAVIPAQFDYHRPSSARDAVALLASLGEDAKIIAGGHSLIPVMKTRLAAPQHLIDLGGIAELKGIRIEGDSVVIGAMTTQHELLASAIIADTLPIIPITSAVIADPQIRYAGTIGGNVANGDPGNDMPALMMCLDASYTLLGPGGERVVKARDFYLGTYYTALEPGEIVSAIHIAALPQGSGYAYEKLKRKVGDYATAAAAVVLTLSGGTCASASIALTNVGDTALLASDAAAALIGTTLDKAAVDKAVEAAEAITSPASDARGTPEYRTKMAGVMVRRAIAAAQARAVG